MYKISAIQISDDIDTQALMAAYTEELLCSDHLELFYETGTELYISVFKYGVVCFFNYPEDKINEFTEVVSNYCEYFYDSALTKTYIVGLNATETKFGFNQADIAYFDIDLLRLIMLNVAQSVALDYYAQKARLLLEETNKHTSLLEKKGKLTMSEKGLKQFIGKTHNLKNQIVENLHILDSVPDIQQKDYLIEANIKLKAGLYLEKKADNINEQLNIIREHLDCFNDILKHGVGLKLEWVIIVLLLIFVIDIIIRHIF